MTIEHLKYFLASARLGSMSLAAQELHISPQAISKAVKNLEKEFNCTLFLRSSTAGLHLTEYGELFLQTAENIMAQIQNFEANIAKKNILSPSSQMDNYFISILCSTNFLSLINSMYRTLRQDYPHVSLSTKTTSPMSSYLPKDLDKYDITILCIPSNISLNDFITDDCELYLLDQSNLRLFCAKESAFAKHKILSNRVLSEIPVVDYSDSDEESELMQLLRLYKIKPLIYSRTNAPMPLMESQVPEYYHFFATKFFVKSFCATIPSNLISIPLKTKISLSYIMIVRKDVVERPAVAILAGMLKENFKDHIIKLS